MATGQGFSIRSARVDRPRRSRWRLVRAALSRLLLLGVIVGCLGVGGCMERLFYQPVVDATPPPPGAEGLWFESDDGTRLYGWWIPAHGRQNHAVPVPTIVHVHGNAGNISSHELFSASLPPAGFNVFLFDYRGYGQSEGSATRRGKLIEDAHAALDAVLSRLDVDPKRVGVYGHSLGGAIALHLMAERSEVAAGVFESPFASWKDAAASVIGGDPPHWFARTLAWMLIPDGQRPDDAIARIDRPMLLIHGTVDSIVPASHSRRLHNAAGGRAELLLVEGAEHNSLQETHPFAKEAMIEFFRRHLAER